VTKRARVSAARVEGSKGKGGKGDGDDNEGGGRRMKRCDGCAMATATRVAGKRMAMATKRAMTMKTRLGGGLHAMPHNDHEGNNNNNRRCWTQQSGGLLPLLPLFGMYPESKSVLVWSQSHPEFAQQH
jgi:hypothetical protein